MNDMRRIILDKLRQIEEEESVRILYACESGSRAWGFPSQDSDYDVRFLYIRPLDEYLSLNEPRDVIERPISDLLDINGWDLKKALKLFRKSNPPLLEWLHSPIIYLEQDDVVSQIRELSADTFSPKACMHHYLHMARGNYREYLQGEQVRLKKYFYVLRPVLACVWMERFQSLPPVAFGALLEVLLPIGSALREAIDELLIRKMAGDELDTGPRIQPIHDFLTEKIRYYEETAAGIEPASGAQEQRLDALFRTTVKLQEEQRK